MNKKFSVAISLLFISGFSQAGNYSVRSYSAPVQQHTSNNQAESALRSQLSNQVGQSNPPKIIYEPKEQVRNVEPQPQQTSSFAWMSEVGSVKQYSKQEIEELIAKINAQQANKQKVSVQKVSFTTPSAVRIAPSTSVNRNNFDEIIVDAANRYGVSVGLVKAIMHTESGFNPRARSPVGAQGLMQLMPATASRFNVSDAYDPIQNINGGVKYLSWLLKRFNGNLTLVLAGYNAGEGNVDKYGGVPPFRETKDYVRRVMTRYHSLYREL